MPFLRKRMEAPIVKEKPVYCLDAQKNVRTVYPGYQVREGERLYRELPDAVIQAVDAIQTRAELLARAQEALSRSDIQVLRCYERSIPLPPAWINYRQRLREIGAGTCAGPLPERPDWP